MCYDSWAWLGMCYPLGHTDLKLRFTKGLRKKGDVDKYFILWGV